MRFIELYYRRYEPEFQQAYQESKASGDEKWNVAILADDPELANQLSTAELYPKHLMDAILFRSCKLLDYFARQECFYYKDWDKCCKKIIGNTCEGESLVDMIIHCSNEVVKLYKSHVCTNALLLNLFELMNHCSEDKYNVYADRLERYLSSTGESIALYKLLEVDYDDFDITNNVKKYLEKRYGCEIP